MQFLLDMGSFLIVSKPTDKGTQVLNTAIQPPPPRPPPPKGAVATRRSPSATAVLPAAALRATAGIPSSHIHSFIIFILYAQYFPKKPLTIKIVYYFTIYRQIILKKYPTQKRLLFLLKIKILVLSTFEYFYVKKSFFNFCNFFIY